MVDPLMVDPMLKLIYHKHYCHDISHGKWEFQIDDTEHEKFDWVLKNITDSFSVVFCGYYYILCLTSSADAMFYKLTWHTSD